MKQKDIVKDIGVRGLATRLKRITDAMSHSVRSMYKQLNIDIEPNWYLILNLVQDNDNISVMDIANSIGFTHQSIHTMTNKMISRGYLTQEKDKNDLRRTIFSLTPKAKDILPKIEQIWNYGEEALLEIIESNIEILEHLKIIEKNLEIASFGERIIQKIESNPNE